MLSIMYPLSGMLMLNIAVLWGLVVSRRYRTRWGLWGVGAMTFFLSQVLHLPLLALVNRLAYAGSPPRQWQPAPLAFLGYALVLGLLAGLSEEFLRYAVLRWWLKEARSWKQALMFGAGHGGLEAIILGGLVLINFFAMLAIRNVDLSTLVPASQLSLAQAQVQAFWGVSWWQPLMGAWERLWTLPIHIFLAVLVMRVFTHHQPWYLPAAIGWHTLVDAAAVLAVRTWGVLPTEALVALFGALSLWGVYLLREADAPLREAPAAAVPPQARPVPLPPLAVDDDSLEDSRYVS